MMFFMYIISCHPLENTDFKIGANCMETLAYEFTTQLENYSLMVSVKTIEGEDVIKVLLSKTIFPLFLKLWDRA